MADDAIEIAARVQSRIDMRAIELATKALTIIEIHLPECRDRFLDVFNALKELREERAQSSKDLYKFLWKIAGSLIFLLLTIIGYLLTKGGVPGVHP